MNAVVDCPLLQAQQQLATQIATACDRVAPTWPLDQFIAVNPYWGWVQWPVAQAAATLGTLAGTRLTAPRAWLRAQWAAGHLQPGHLWAAARHAHGAGTGDAQLQAVVQELTAALQADAAPVPRMALVTDLRDAREAPQTGTGWSARVTHQISQHCAAYFDRHQAGWGVRHPEGLYAGWRTQLAADRGLHWPQGRAALVQRLAALPDDPRQAIAQALDGLQVPPEGRAHYLTAVLLALQGWAAWCAYQRWQARLGGEDDDHIEQLLAIRLAWEWLLADDAAAADRAGWARQWASAGEQVERLRRVQAIDWMLQHAAELAYQQPLLAGLASAADVQQRDAAPPDVQAVFCIDVRSEVLRRALEAVHPGVQTRGFAGFFGLPVAYTPLGSELVRPQLPGLLAPGPCVTEEASEPHLAQVLARRRRAALGLRKRWAAFRGAPASGFSFVESMGLWYGARLVADSLPDRTARTRWEDAGLSAPDSAALRPRWPGVDTDAAGAAAVAHRVLTAMGLVADFAPLVLLVGHGSQSANNPHAAGLDCGACGGQAGDVNARVLADMLNHPDVRAHLAQAGMVIPPGTHFVPALHNTTTDAVALYDTDAVPAAHAARLADLRQWLAAAGERARAERAASLGLAPLADQPERLRDAIQARANDWAQVRPEWGLANNAAFIVAPRARSRHLHLAGRSFLHDYDHRLDPDGAVLELIMTAPMVVTHWINMQYHASTVDNRRYGSGNKLLHNVVGGTIGVFEGNGGDLRIGLPMQSVHDGQRPMHAPLRLSVVIEAPAASIDRVLAAHERVRQLVAHGWLHLFQIEPGGTAVAQRVPEGWVPVRS